MASTWWLCVKHSHGESLLHQSYVSDLLRAGGVRGNPWMTRWAGLTHFGFLVTKAEGSVCSPEKHQRAEMNSCIETHPPLLFLQPHMLWVLSKPKEQAHSKYPRPTFYQTRLQMQRFPVLFCFPISLWKFLLYLVGFFFFSFLNIRYLWMSSNNTFLLKEQKPDRRADWKLTTPVSPAALCGADFSFRNLPN